MIGVNDVQAEQAVGVTMYARLAHIFRGLIAEDAWPLDTQIPTIPELARTYGAGQVTVRQALALLADEGLIKSSRGRGTFVTGRAGGLTADLEFRAVLGSPDRAANEDIDVLSVESERFPPELLIPSDQRADGEYVHIRKRHLFRLKPFALIDVFVRATDFSRFPSGAEREAKIGTLLAQHGEERAATHRQQVTIAYADLSVAKALQYPAGAVLGRVRRWQTSASGVLLYASNNLYRADMFVLETIGVPEAGSLLVPRLPNSDFA